MCYVEQYDCLYGPYSFDSALHVCGLMNYYDPDSARMVDRDGDYME